MQVYGYRTIYRAPWVVAIDKVEKTAERQPRVAIRKVAGSWEGPFFLQQCSRRPHCVQALGLQHRTRQAPDWPLPLQGVKFPSKNCTNTSGITLCEGQAGLRLWPGQGCGNMGRPPRGDGGGRSSKAAAGRRNWGNVSGKGGWRKLQRAARSEHKGPASNVEPGKGSHCAPLASTFPICKKRLPASSCASQTNLLGPSLCLSIRKMATIQLRKWSRHQSP